jgi:putative transposase
MEDNVIPESLFHTLKTEQVYHQLYQTGDKDKRDIPEYIEVFCNRERLYSSNNYSPPADYEMQLKPA